MAGLVLLFIIEGQENGKVFSKNNFDIVNNIYSVYYLKIILFTFCVSLIYFYIVFYRQYFYFYCTFLHFIMLELILTEEFFLLLFF